jgi:hypothetical protein
MIKDGVCWVYRNPTPNPYPIALASSLMERGLKAFVGIVGECILRAKKLKSMMLYISVVR